MKKFYALASILSICSFCIYSKITTKDSTQQNHDAIQSKEFEKVETPKIFYPAQTVDSDDGCTLYEVEMNAKPISDEKDFDKKISVELKELLRSDIDLKSRSIDETDERKAALFSIATYCTDIGHYFQRPDGSEDELNNMHTDMCERIPEKTKKDPISLLISGHGMLSSNGLLLISKNLLVDMKIRSFAANNEKSTVDFRAMRESEDLAKRAALNGSKSAFLFLAQAYEKGAFGKRDLVRALLYASALEQSEKNNESSQIFNYISGQMIYSQRNYAERIIKRCSKKSGVVNNQLANPFFR